MLRKSMIAHCAAASIVVFSPNVTMAGDQGSDHFRHYFFFSSGFWGPGYYDGYWGYPDYSYDNYFKEPYRADGSCAVEQRRVHTSYGWRVRPVQVCG